MGYRLTATLANLTDQIEKKEGVLPKSWDDDFVVGRVPSRGEFLRESEDARWGQRAYIRRFVFRQHAQEM